MEFTFKKVRKQLDELGYVQVFNYDSLPLVEKLTGDLIRTTESLKKYKKIAKEVSEERDDLQIGAEPYKCDNAKLVKECNDLHLTFLHIREQYEKVQRDLKRRLVALESDKLDCNLQCDKLKNRVRDLQLELSKRSTRFCTSCDKNKQTGGKSNVKASSTSNLQGKRCCNSKCELNSALAMSDQKVMNLTREIKKLKDEHIQLTEMNETYKNQLNNRDREIIRLNQMLEGGRPIKAMSQDCCYKDVEGKLSRMQNEICCLRKEKCELSDQLKESVAKQHEAMRRALNLADRNKQLEKELRDIDQMALAVEADCNSTVKSNADKVNRLQEQMHESCLQMQTLERELSEIKREKQQYIAEVDALKIEKKHLQSVLETALEDKKRLNNKINQFTVIEHDLNLEIDRLVQASAAQKRKISELECKLLSDKFESYECSNSKTSLHNDSLGNTGPPKKVAAVSKNKLRDRSSFSKRSKKSGGAGDTLFSKKFKGKLNKKRSKATVLPSAKLEDSLIVTSMPKKVKKTKSAKKDSEDKKKGKKESKKKVDKKSDNDSDEGDASSVTDKSEKNKTPNNSPNKNYAGDNNEFYPCCCCKQKPTCADARFSERYDVGKEHLDSGKDNNHAELLQKLNLKEQSITSLQYENKMLAQEKHNLMTRLEKNLQCCTCQGSELGSGRGGAGDLKSELKKVEREREMLRSDVIRLEEEKNAMKMRLKSMSDTQALEQNKMKEILLDAESQVRQLERERRDLMHGQGSRRATISVLEEQCEDLTNQLRTCQCDLNQQRSMYTQLKSLHEQTDRALSDSQAQLVQVESELERTRCRCQVLEKDRLSHDQEVSNLRNDMKTMRNTLSKIDEEKDGLLMSVDDKTEKVCMLEEQIRAKNNELQKLHGSVTELTEKLGATLQSTTSKDELLKNATADTHSLRLDLEKSQRQSELAIEQNRKLQGDLTSALADIRNTRDLMEICKQENRELKQQLQTYVAEVKRFEDLMTEKEMERSELLDQFKSLSQEAMHLENNNHHLESEASQSKVQLSVTLDHVQKLEDKVNCQCDMIVGYEDQVAQLKSNVASLQSKLEGTQQQQERAEADLASIRCLCMKLDQQKDNLIRELNEKDNEKEQLGREAQRMRHESEMLHTSLSRDRTSLKNMEQLLAEARHDSVQLKLQNQELEAEVRALKKKIETVEGNLNFPSSTFSYSANVHNDADGNVCTCCIKCPNHGLKNKGTAEADVIETTTTMFTSKDGECKCTGQFTHLIPVKADETERELKSSTDDKRHASNLKSPKCLEDTRYAGSCPDGPNKTCQEKTKAMNLTNSPRTPPCRSPNCHISSSSGSSTESSSPNQNSSSASNKSVCGSQSPNFSSANTTPRSPSVGRAPPNASRAPVNLPTVVPTARLPSTGISAARAAPCRVHTPTSAPSGMRTPPTVNTRQNAVPSVCPSNFKCPPTATAVCNRKTTSAAMSSSTDYNRQKITSSSAYETVRALAEKRQPPATAAAKRPPVSKTTGSSHGTNSRKDAKRSTNYVVCPFASQKKDIVVPDRVQRDSVLNRTGFSSKILDGNRTDKMSAFSCPGRTDLRKIPPPDDKFRAVVTTDKTSAANKISTRDRSSYGYERAAQTDRIKTASQANQVSNFNNGITTVNVPMNTLKVPSILSTGSADPGYVSIQCTCTTSYATTPVFSATTNVNRP